MIHLGLSTFQIQVWSGWRPKFYPQATCVLVRFRPSPYQASDGFVSPWDVGHSHGQTRHFSPSPWPHRRPMTHAYSTLSPAGIGIHTVTPYSLPAEFKTIVTKTSNVRQCQPHSCRVLGRLITRYQNGMTTSPSVYQNLKSSTPTCGFEGLHTHRFEFRCNMVLRGNRQVYLSLR
jgi:hypothetical protein